MASTYNPLGKAAFSSTSYAYYALLSDGDDIVSRPGTIASATGIVKRGTIVNVDPATGAITIPATVAVCNGILADDTDATSATVPANVYIAGKFKADAVIWPGALSHALVTDQLRDTGIFLESVMYTDGTIVKSAPTKAEEDEAKKQVEKNKAESKKAAEATEETAKEGPKPSDSPSAHLTAEERDKHPEYGNPAVWTNEPAPGTEPAEKPVSSPAHKSGEHTPKR